MWIFRILIIIVLIVFFILYFKIKNIKAEAVNVYSEIIRLERKREEERKKRVQKNVNSYSHKIHQLLSLNLCFNDFLPNKKPEFHYTARDYFKSKRQLDRASTYDYMSNYSREAQRAINYQACRNDLIDQYRLAIKSIREYITPDWAIKESRVNVDEFLTVEKSIFCENILQNEKTNETPYIYVYLSYTSPAGRNHWTKTNTIYYDLTPQSNVYRSLTGSYSDHYHRIKRKNVNNNNNNNNINLLKNEEIIVAPRSGCIELKLDNTLNVIETYEFINRVDIQSVIIPASVKIIKKEAFKGCLNLKKVTILGEEIVIEDDAFSGCYHLEKVKYAKN